MEAVIIIIVVIFLIWIFSANRSSSKPTYIPQKQPGFDFNDFLAREAYDKAWSLSESGDYQNSILQYDHAIRIKPKAVYYNNRAYAKSKIDDYKGAIADYDKAIQLSPIEASYFANRGITHHNNDKNDLACEDWRKASQLGSSVAKELLEKYCKPKLQQPQTTPVRGQVAINPNETILNQFGITYLYHMTHKNNLENILRNGLLSHTKAHAGLNQVDIADDQVNTRRERKETIYNRSIHDYVPLYFNPKNPMLFRRRNIQNDILIFAIDRNLILNPNSIFTDGNAASQGTRFFNSTGQLRQLNWQCINGEFWNEFSDGKRIKCAEVLVFPKIDVASIKRIYCKSSLVQTSVSRQTRNYSHIAVEQNNNIYFSDYQSSSYDNTIEPLDDLPF